MSESSGEHLILLRLTRLEARVGKLESRLGRIEAESTAPGPANEPPDLEPASTVRPPTGFGEPEDFLIPRKDQLEPVSSTGAVPGVPPAPVSPHHPPDTLHTKPERKTQPPPATKNMRQPQPASTGATCLNN
jgi:hypothetical protein